MTFVSAARPLEYGVGAREGETCRARRSDGQGDIVAPEIGESARHPRARLSKESMRSRSICPWSQLTRAEIQRRQHEWPRRHRLRRHRSISVLSQVACQRQAGGDPHGDALGPSAPTWTPIFLVHFPVCHRRRGWMRTAWFHAEFAESRAASGATRVSTGTAWRASSQRSGRLRGLRPRRI